MKKKVQVLLMGKSGAGKTSMRSIIFSNYIAKDTRRLGATIDVEHSHVRFLGNLVLNLWDCGGQEAFMENYFSSQRDHIFRNVAVLIYVFDVESRDRQRDLQAYRQCLDAMQMNSKDASVFVLIHKMDLVHETKRAHIFKERVDELSVPSGTIPIRVFATSIWDESLYKAWSEIVHSLIPNIGKLEHQLKRFCKVCEADEMILFERTTFLVISHVTTDESVIEQHYMIKNSVTGSDQVSGQVRKRDLESGSGTKIMGMDTGTVSGRSQDEVSGLGSGTALDLGSNSGSVPGLGSGQAQNSGSGSLVKKISDFHALDAHRFEKISNIIKQFKLCCTRSQTQFQTMQLQHRNFSAFIEAFTTNTYIMVVVSDPKVSSAATLMNIAAAKSHFEGMAK